MVAQDGSIEHFLLTVRVNAYDPVPHQIVHGQDIQLGRAQNVGHPGQSLAGRRVLEKGTSAVFDAQICLELPVRHIAFLKDAAYVVPDLHRHGIHIGVRCLGPHDLQQRFAIFGTGTMDADLLQKAALIIQARNIQSVTGSVMCLRCRRPHPRIDTETE